MASECVDVIEKKSLCVTLSKVSEPVPEMREEESVNTPAQPCRKRKGLRVLRPAKRKRSKKVQKPRAISVRVEQGRADEELADDIGLLDNEVVK